MIYASFGTVSHGTMRNEDLIPTFVSELEYQIKRNRDSLSEEDSSRYVSSLAEIQTFTDNDESDYDSEYASELVEDLFALLDEFAPPYGYFGEHPGDGSDYGFWLSEYSIESCFDGLRVNDLCEIPEDYSGEVLSCNDHGNLTLYYVDAGDCREIWSIV